MEGLSMYEWYHNELEVLISPSSYEMIRMGLIGWSSKRHQWHIFGPEENFYVQAQHLPSEIELRIFLSDVYLKNESFSDIRGIV